MKIVKQIVSIFLGIKDNTEFSLLVFEIWVTENFEYKS